MNTSKEGAIVINDTYNANYDSMKADLPSKKLVYVDGVMTRIPYFYIVFYY